MVAYPASETMVEGDCASTAVLSEKEWYYDNLTALGALGTKGNATRSRARVDDTGTEAQDWLPYTTVGYDALGRATAVTDTKGNTAGSATNTPHPSDPPHSLPAPEADAVGVRATGEIVWLSTRLDWPRSLPWFRSVPTLPAASQVLRVV